LPRQAKGGDYVKNGYTLLVIAAAAVAAALIGSPEVEAAKNKGPKGSGFFSYTVQFQCGENDSGNSPSVLEGEYTTAATVHNNAGVLPATVQTHVALSWPPGAQAPGPVSDATQLSLPPGAALHITCPEIPDSFIFPTPPTVEQYYEGVLVIDSTTPLDVVATYTSGKDDDGESDENRLRTLQVVHVPERLVDRGPQVVLCHLPGDEDHTIAVAEAAVQAHLDHGDLLGPCPAPL
jgi:hypothetical protein